MRLDARQALPLHVVLQVQVQHERRVDPWVMVIVLVVLPSRGLGELRRFHPVLVILLTRQPKYGLK